VKVYPSFDVNVVADHANLSIRRVNLVFAPCLVGVILLNADVSTACVDGTGDAADAGGVGGWRCGGESFHFSKALFQFLDLSLCSPFLLDQVERNAGLHHKCGLALLDQKQVLSRLGQLATERGDILGSFSHWRYSPD
jgi:hypothetical protein